MITDTIEIRPRYNEVDRMGYVYHANYVTYCHQGRTELLRKLNLHDHELEDKGVILPVIDFSIQYKKPAFYDEMLTLKTTIKEMPEVRFHFEFEITNADDDVIATAESTVVFVNSDTRQPILVPPFIDTALNSAFTREALKK